MAQFKSFNYDEFLQNHRDCARRFGPIHSIPMIDSPYKRCQDLYSGGLVLDIGGGAGKMLQKALGIRDDLYFLLDDDPSISCAYSAFSDLPQEACFSMVVGHQVAEHIPIDACITLFKDVATRMQPGATIHLSVPNTAHPTRFWANPTHVTPWSFSHLGGALQVAGFTCVEVARYNKFPYPRNPWDRLVTAAVCRVFRVDWCDSIMVVAKK